MTLKWHEGYGRKLLRIFPAVERRQVLSSLCGGYNKSLSFHLPVVLRLVQMAIGGAGRDPPLAGLQERAGKVGLAGGAGILLFSGGSAVMDSRAA